jgi:serine/threonine-protein kinase
MDTSAILKGRYQIKEVLGKGGMGIVYKAFDSVLRREVAIKTLLDISDPGALELFHREYEVLAHINHPNIVEIIDIGEFEFEGGLKPFFIMPMLPGASLGQLIKSSSHRLTVERTVDIISQTCRGLHAAHEKGLVHRDMKPSNIIVLEDDSVKIIDFGMAHTADSHSRTGLKGTLLYMAPEQAEMKAATALSDIFALGVVAFETLTRRRPFEGSTERDIVQAILHQIPPPASDLNPMVSPTVARVIHKAMAKQPYHRFSSARDFGDTLQRALRNEPIEIFDPAKIRPRLERASKAFEQADYQFAAEILAELEAEGHIDHDMTVLRVKVDQALRQKRIQQLLESAKTRMEGQEYPLALQKVQEALELDASHAAALSLKHEIEEKRSAGKIEDWLSLARQHIANHAYPHAREALKNALELKPKDSRVGQLLSEVDWQEQEYQRVHSEKHQLYRGAVDAWSRGEVSAALSKLQQVMALDEQAPDSSAPERVAAYRSLYNQVRSEHDAMNSAYAEARKLLAEGKFAAALSVCDQYLSKYPGHALFQAVKFDLEEKQRQELSARIAEVDRRVEAEPNLDKRVDILKEALDLHPQEPHFERALRSTREKRDLVNSIVARARLHEERSQFTDALAQWEILRTIYSQYPGLSFEIDRLGKRREQQARVEGKARWVKQIDQQMAAGDYDRAMSSLRQAGVEFPDDTELTELEKLIQLGKAKVSEALRSLAEGQEKLAAGQFEEGLEVLRKAHRQDERSTAVQQALIEALVDRARKLLDTDWRAAEPLIQEALDLDPGHGLAKSLRTLAEDRKKEEFIQLCVAQARRAQAQGDISGALDQVKAALTAHPADPRLSQLYSTLSKDFEDTRHRQARHHDLEKLRRLNSEAQRVAEPEVLKTLAGEIQSLAAPYHGDAEFESAISSAHRRLTTRIEALESMQTITTAAPAGDALTVNAAAGGASVTPPVPVPPPPAKPPVPPEKPAEVAPPAAGPARVPEVSGPATPVAAAEVRAWPAASQSPGAAVKPPAPPILPPSQPAVRQLEPPPPEPSPEDVVRPPAGRKVPWLLIGVVVVAAAVLAILPVPRFFKHRPAPQPVALTTPVPPPAPAPVPQLPDLRVYTDLEKATVTLDGNPAGQLEGGQFTLDKLSEGQHALEIGDGTSTVKISVNSAPDSMPQIQGALETQNLKAIAVTSGPRNGEVLSSYGPIAASLDGKDIGSLSPTGLPIPGLASGTHDLDVGAGTDEKKISFQLSAAPSLMVFLSADRDVGNLLVVAGQDGATVLVNGKPYPRLTRHGELVIANLAPKQYSVSVVKDGFQQAPAQNVSIVKGQASKLVFALEAVPTAATLVIAGAMPSTNVLLDGVSLGLVQQDGSFTASNIKPGQHTIGLRRDQFKSKDLQKEFVAGGSVRLNAGDVAMTGAAAAPAFVPPKLVVQTVAGAQVAIDGQPAGQTDSKGRLEVTPVAPGDHAVEIVLKPYNNFKQTIAFSAGHIVSITPKLLASLAVEHKHLVGGCNGTLTVGDGKIVFQASNRTDSFNYPLTAVKRLGAAESGKGFFIEITGAKRYTFHAADAATDLQIIQNAMPRGPGDNSSGDRPSLLNK